MSYGTVEPVTNAFSDSAVHRVSAVINDLPTGRTYHYRLGASNSAGVVYGIDRVFRVEPPGKYAAWGDNKYGGATIPYGLSNVVELTGTLYASMALREDGTITFWGTNSAMLSNFVATVSNIVSVSASSGHVLALDKDGFVHASGASGPGPAGNATNVPPGLSNVVAVAAAGADGIYHSLALKADGNVVAWGNNTYGMTNVPASATNVVAIAGGIYHSLALRANGTMIGWGDNYFGQSSAGYSPDFRCHCERPFA